MKYFAVAGIWSFHTTDHRLLFLSRLEGSPYVQLSWCSAKKALFFDSHHVNLSSAPYKLIRIWAMVVASSFEKIAVSKSLFQQCVSVLLRCCTVASLGSNREGWDCTWNDIGVGTIYHPIFWPFFHPQSSKIPSWIRLIELCMRLQMREGLWLNCAFRMVDEWKYLACRIWPASEFGVLDQLPNFFCQQSFVKSFQVFEIESTLIFSTT